MVYKIEDRYKLAVIETSDDNDRTRYCIAALSNEALSLFYPVAESVSIQTLDLEARRETMHKFEKVIAPIISSAFSAGLENKEGRGTSDNHFSLVKSGFNQSSLKGNVTGLPYCEMKNKMALFFNNPDVYEIKRAVEKAYAFGAQNHEQRVQIINKTHFSPVLSMYGTVWQPFAHE